MDSKLLFSLRLTRLPFSYDIAHLSLRTCTVSVCSLQPIVGNGWNRVDCPECLLLSVSLIFKVVNITRGFFLLSSIQTIKTLQPRGGCTCFSSDGHAVGPAAPSCITWGCRDQSPFGEQRFSVLFLQQDRSALGGGVCCLKNAKVANGTWQKPALSPASAGLLMLSGVQQKWKLGGKTLLLETSG